MVECRFFAPRQFVSSVCATLVASFLVSAAWGQLTVKSLVGDAVSTSNKKYPNLEDAIKRFENNDAEGAREYLERAKKATGKLPPTDVMLAKMFMTRRDGNRARLLLERAVAQFPDDPESYLIFADEAFKSNRFTEASALFEKAEELNESFAENTKRKEKFAIRVVAGHAAVAQRRGQWDKARGYLEEWIEMDDISPTAHQRLGATLFQLDDVDGAYQEFAKARELREDLSHPYVALAQMFSAKKEVEKARENFEKAYAAEGDNDITAQAYATWLLQQSEFDKAQEIATRLREKNPESEIALLMSGVVAQLKGERDAAEEALSKLLDVNPSDAKATNLLALLLIDSDKPSDQEKALRYAQMNAQRFSKNPQTLVTLAWVQHRLGREREADVALQQGTQAGNLNADSGYLVSKILAERDKKDQALKVLVNILQNTDASFLYRKDAEDLYQELGGNLDNLTPQQP